MDNFLDTTKKLKENIVNLKKEQKSADKSAKILEKQTSIEKEKLKEKIRNLEFLSKPDLQSRVFELLGL